MTEIAEQWINQRVQDAKWSSKQYDLDIQFVAVAVKSFAQILVDFAEFYTENKKGDSK
jgi:hypothetical protein